jgi:hypothetical protein
MMRYVVRRRAYARLSGAQEWNEEEEEQGEDNGTSLSFRRCVHHFVLSYSDVPTMFTVDGDEKSSRPQLNVTESGMM